MKEKSTIRTPTSHHLLTSRPQYFNVVVQMMWRSCAPVRHLRLSIFSLALAALLAALSPAPALAKSGPKPKQRGPYVVTVSGYYHGTGTADAEDKTVRISVNVKDPAGKAHLLTAPALAREDERHYLFSGTGSLDGMEVLIDGRVDAPDPLKNEVLKAGRIVFTFKVIANGKHGRGGGEKKGSAKGNSGNTNSGNTNSGNTNSGNTNSGNTNSGNANGNGSSGNGNSGNGNNGNGVGNGGGNGTGNEGHGGGNNGGNNGGGNGRGNNSGNGNRVNPARQ
jgi:hypothetical protein